MHDDEHDHQDEHRDETTDSPELVRVIGALREVERNARDVDAHRDLERLAADEPDDEPAPSRLLRGVGVSDSAHVLSPHYAAARARHEGATEFLRGWVLRGGVRRIELRFGTTPGGPPKVAALDVQTGAVWEAAAPDELALVMGWNPDAPTVAPCPRCGSVIFMTPIDAPALRVCQRCGHSSSST